MSPVFLISLFVTLSCLCAYFASFVHICLELSGVRLERRLCRMARASTGSRRINARSDLQSLPGPPTDGSTTVCTVPPAAPPTSSRSPHAPTTRSEILRRVEGLNKHWAHCGRNAAVQDNSRLTAPPDAESALDRHLSFTGSRPPVHPPTHAPARPHARPPVCPCRPPHQLKDASYHPRGRKGAEARPTASVAAPTEAMVVSTGRPTRPTRRAGRRRRPDGGWWG